MKDSCRFDQRSSAPATAALRFAVLVVALEAAGCGGTDRQAGAGAPAAGEPAPAAAAIDRAGIVLDGDIAEWPTNLNVVADSAHLYFRVKIEGETDTLQAMRRPRMASRSLRLRSRASSVNFPLLSSRYTICPRSLTSVP